MTLAAWLVRSGAQRDVVAWAEPYGDAFGAAWAECPRGDWLLAIAVRAGVPAGAVARAAVAIARFGAQDEPGRWADVLATAERCLADPAAPRADLRAAADRAEREAADAPDPATSALGLAVACALRSIEAPEDAA